MNFEMYDPRIICGVIMFVSLFVIFYLYRQINDLNNQIQLLKIPDEDHETKNMVADHTGKINQLDNKLNHFINNYVKKINKEPEVMVFHLEDLITKQENESTVKIEEEKEEPDIFIH